MNKESLKQPPLKLWQILLTMVGAIIVLTVIAGLMFQNAIDMGMVQ